jgi:hypothetical protein
MIIIWGTVEYQSSYTYFDPAGKKKDIVFTVSDSSTRQTVMLLNHLETHSPTFIPGFKQEQIDFQSFRVLAAEPFSHSSIFSIQWHPQIYFRLTFI